MGTGINIERCFFSNCFFLREGGFKAPMPTERYGDVISVTCLVAARQWVIRCPFCGFVYRGRPKGLAACRYFARCCCCCCSCWLLWSPVTVYGHRYRSWLTQVDSSCKCFPSTNTTAPASTPAISHMRLLSSP